MPSFTDLGKKIYDMNNPREVRRMMVFVVRCWLNRGRMRHLFAFFAQDELLRSVAAVYPFVYEQPTRAFFYNRSTFDERARLGQQHGRGAALCRGAELHYAHQARAAGVDSPEGEGGFLRRRCIFGAPFGKAPSRI